jgi:LysR family glycine cleavage system transcriptional activator
VLSVPPSETIIAALEVARTGSMAVAAENLGVTPGAISRRIKTLEHWLGLPIFERAGRGVRTTGQGLVFLRQAEPSLAAVEALRMELSSWRDTRAIRISALPSMVRLWLMPNLKRLEAVSPNQVVEIIPEFQLAHLDTGETDLAVRYGAGSWPGTEAHLLFADFLVPAASPALAASRPADPIDWLARQTLLMDGDGADWREWRQLAKVPQTSNVRKRQFLDHDVTVEAARQGLGVVLLRAPMAASALGDGRLQTLGFPPLQSTKGHYVVVQAGESRVNVLRLAAEMRACAAETLAQFRATAAGAP